MYITFEFSINKIKDDLRDVMSTILLYSKIKMRYEYGINWFTKFVKKKAVDGGERDKRLGS